MAGEGGYLQKAREMRGLTLADAEEKTKIKRSYLQALEHEDYEKLPGDAYIRGFLRNYARLLSLDPDEIIEKYEESTSSKKELPEVTQVVFSKTRTLSWPLVLLVVVVLGVSGGLVYFMNQTMTNSSPDITYGNGNFKAPAIQQNVPKEEKNNDSSSTDVSAAPLTVHIEVAGYCWVYVKADGEGVMEGNFDKGYSQDITADEKIEIVSVGRPHNISVSVNGEVMDITPYITKDGTGANIVLTADS